MRVSIILLSESFCAGKEKVAKALEQFYKFKIRYLPDPVETHRLFLRENEKYAKMSKVIIIFDFFELE